MCSRLPAKARGREISQFNRLLQSVCKIPRASPGQEGEDDRGSAARRGRGVVRTVSRSGSSRTPPSQECESRQRRCDAECVLPMRSSRSVSHSCGLTPLSLAVSSKEYMAAARSPPQCDPSPLPSMVPDADGLTRTDAEHYTRKNAVKQSLSNVIRRPQTVKWRPEPESNRRARICSPLRHHSAIGPRCTRNRVERGAVSRGARRPQSDSLITGGREARPMGRRTRARAFPCPPSPPRAGWACT